MQTTKDGIQHLDPQDVTRAADDPQLTPKEADFYIDICIPEYNQMLAANPAVPVEHLPYLAGIYPHIVLRNPALQLIMLENPQQWNEILFHVAEGLRKDIKDERHCSGCVHNAAGGIFPDFDPSTMFSGDIAGTAIHYLKTILIPAVELMWQNKKNAQVKVAAQKINAKAKRAAKPKVAKAGPTPAKKVPKKKKP